MAVRTIVVDGYNLIGWSAGVRVSRLESDRQRLVARLARYVDARGHRVTVVFDGAGAGGRTPSRTRPGLTVAYSPAGTKADAVIVEEARRLNGECVVVTDDRALAMHCERHDAIVLSCEAFVRRMDAAARPEPERPAPADRAPAAQPISADRSPTRGDPDDDLLARMLDVPEGMAEQKALDEPPPPTPASAGSRRERRRAHILADL